MKAYHNQSPSHNIDYFPTPEWFAQLDSQYPFYSKYYPSWNLELNQITLKLLARQHASCALVNNHYEMAQVLLSEISQDQTILTVTPFHTAWIKEAHKLEKKIDSRSLSEIKRDRHLHFKTYDVIMASVPIMSDCEQNVADDIKTLTTYAHPNTLWIIDSSYQLMTDDLTLEKILVDHGNPYIIQVKSLNDVFKNNLVSALAIITEPTLLESFRYKITEFSLSGYVECYYAT